MDIDIDSAASRREDFIKEIKKYFESIGKEVINVGTYGVATAKLAIQVAARGLNYSPEIGNYLSSLIPMDRGVVRNLNNCYYGNEEKGFAPITSFIKEMNDYPDIWEVAKNIEGVITRRGVHRAGILIYNGKATDYNATMLNNKGDRTSQWELHASEDCGGLKFDLLTTDALDRIKVCLELLIKFGYIDWKGSLKKTYDYYLSPDILDYDNLNMWEKVWNNEIVSLFQFSTPMGLQAAKIIKPKSLLELSQANSLMRLMPEGAKKTPMEEFAEYKEKPWLLSQEIENLNATQEEKEILYNYMKQYGGVLDSQESLMWATMLPFTKYTIDESNKVRKIIAKKKINEVEQAAKDYFERGKELGTSYDILDYIWNRQAARQMGYSFSSIHTVGYSIIAVQEMNLFCRFPSIFWNTACLIVDSAGILNDEDSVSFEENEDIIDSIQEKENEEEEEIKIDKKQAKSINYGKISTAISTIKQYGVQVVPPDINKSDFTFNPNIEENVIYYGIKGITSIGEEIAKIIIDNRPYKDFSDFVSKIKLTKPQIINLIKAGCFDNFEDREILMKKYIESISEFKTNLTMSNLSQLVEKELIPDKYDYIIKIYNFNKYLKTVSRGINFYLDDYSYQFYSKFFDIDILTPVDNGFLISQKKWAKLYENSLKDFKLFLKDKELIQKFNQSIFNEKWNQYCKGNLSTWEMDSLGFYSKEHELDYLDLSLFNIENFNDLPEEPEIEKEYDINSKKINIYKLHLIAGTIIEKNNNKNIITLLTQYGIVQVKIYKNTYNIYNKRLSEKNEVTNKKTIIEDSWFSRGNKIIILGIRRGDNFIPKKYKNSIFKAPFILIENPDFKNGKFSFKVGRD